MVEEAARVGFALGELRARCFALGHILDREEDAAPVILVAGKDRALELHI